MRAPKNPPQRNYSQYVYALLSRQNCIDLGQIPRERDQHRPRGAAPHAVRRSVRVIFLSSALKFPTPERLLHDQKL